MTIGRRLLLLTTFVTTIALGGSLYAVWVAFSLTQERQLDGAILALAEDDRQRIEAGETPSVVLDRPGPTANHVGPLPHLGALYDADGAVAARSRGLTAWSPDRAHIDRPRTRPFDLTGGPKRLRGLTLDVSGGRTLFVGTSRADVDGDDAFLARAMAVAFVVGLGWVVTVTAWFLRRFTRGHEVIATTARAVAAGDLTARVGQADAETAQLAGDVDRMIERLALLVDAQKRFIAEAAHELRSPLTTLYGHLQHAASKDRTAAEYREHIDEALDSAGRLKGTAEDLLALARLGTQSGAEDATLVAWKDVLVRVEEATRREAAERGGTITFHRTTSHVFGRATELERLCRNLVENALRHGGPRPTVTVRVEPHPRGVRLLVEDEGPGIAEPDRDRVFDTFFRSARTRGDEVAGTGLGLPIAREIARAHGGDVEVLSSERGARFAITLPAPPRQLVSA